ncbi:putative S-adenosyl-L-methionine-dependent methyltransferase [Helianthus annuus]|uniref:Methyltransferase n=1 Tax=Helianthus annuus TaxID=4232 RepID=A0A251UHB1_HELAN|nr:probable methyltransferase PMT15 [Helianthus annuus]KAF5800486.1 putative S-adenosyl-L-methionine-dependent methyltransferase [Helianthus annuus]KAJ0551794.1 putative S-adenosyl-L-methionine-dependent methyltransferase [Helianthus annuus]
MAGQTPPYYTPTTKPTTAVTTNLLRKDNVVLACLVIFLCSFFYLFGTWQPHATTTPSSTLTTTINCPSTTTNTNTATETNSNKHLDFTTHHSATVNDVVIKTYPPCPNNFSEYTPCQDQKRSLKFPRDRLIYRERHCPEKHELLKCRVPAPYGYKNPFKWPDSRDLVWYANVPHKDLTVEKAVQNWIRFEGDRFRFPGGGTMFPNGADAYIDDIGKLINLNDGSIRTAIDTGCGVASWGAYLLSRNIMAMSFAPRDTHEAQVQFALERGVPALIGVIASKRLPYPSRAFDMAHCSRCLIQWGQYDGVYLIEVDRVLRPGGYWILSGPPINWENHWRGWERTQEDLNEEQTQIEKVAKSLCWKKLVQKGDLAIWQKPINHLDCKTGPKFTQTPTFCPVQNPDSAWYTDIETCLTRLPEVSNEEEVAGGAIANWPKRLDMVPPRVSSGSIDGVTPEIFQKDVILWKKRISYYKTVNSQLGQPGRYRNLLDMNAFLGGFAASLVEDPLWVMNIVPVEAKADTLGAIYERGLIGTYQSWCEAMSTYPRTYDLIHADSVFTLYKDRCEMEDIMLEMDRILRPEGSVIIRDDVDLLVKIKKIAEGLNWESQIVDHEDGPLVREKLLFAVKLYWTAPADSDQGS